MLGTQLLRLRVRGMLQAGLALALLGLLHGVAAGEDGQQIPGIAIRQQFAHEIDRQLAVPESEQEAYAGRIAEALSLAGLPQLPPQFVMMVDRSPAVQAAFVYLWSGDDNWLFIGASPASTGQAGRYDYFLTPLGVFAHTLANPDFRAEGTLNAQGIRGYGRKGLRVFDFGWAIAERGWGAHARSVMRLQMHATDPDILEPLLGRARSKGCIRIPATLDAFIDHYGLLDADYERAAAQGPRLWVLQPDRESTPWSGQYLVVVDSHRDMRPYWSPAPRRR